MSLYQLVDCNHRGILLAQLSQLNATNSISKRISNLVADSMGPLVPRYNVIVLTRHVTVIKSIDITFPDAESRIFRQNWIITIGLLPDTQNCVLRIHRESRERFPCNRGLAIPICITAPACERVVMHAGFANYQFHLKSVARKTLPTFPVHAQPTILRIW